MTVFWVTAESAADMVRPMGTTDQDEAWRRLTDARIKALEAAVQPAKIRRTKAGKPLPPPAYEPGDRLPMTRWMELRLIALEMLLRLILDADERRSEAEEFDHGGLEFMIEPDLERLEAWSRMQVEPDLSRRETMAVIQMARVILMECHQWPLLELEEDEG